MSTMVQMDRATIVAMERLDFIDVIKQARRALEEHENFYYYDALTDIIASTTQADLRLSPDLVLEPEAETDFILKPEYYGAWITVGDVSVHITRRLSGVGVDLYPLHYEDTEPLASAYVGDLDTDLPPGE